jgi:hypothetical protein
LFNCKTTINALATVADFKGSPDKIWTEKTC